MKVKIKRLSPNAVIPHKAHPTDAGYDLVATSKHYDEDGNVVYGTGLAFEIPQGYVGLLFPRSSNAKQHLLLSNSVGILDAGYRGEVMFKFKMTYNDVEDGRLFHAINKEWEIGDRIGQLIIMPYPEIEFEETDNLSNSDRGDGGYGSTGN